MKLEHLVPHKRVNSKWIKDLNDGLETMKVLEENISSKILDTSYSNFFFSNISLWAKERREKNKQMGIHQTKKILHSKGNNQQNIKTTH